MRELEMLFSLFFEQGALYFHIALRPASYVVYVVGLDCEFASTTFLCINNSETSVLKHTVLLFSLHLVPRQHCILNIPVHFSHVPARV